MLKRNDKRVLGMSRKKLFTILTIGELVLCIAAILGGYIVYEGNHPVANTSIEPPQSTSTVPALPGLTITDTPQPTFTVEPSPTFTATPAPTFTPAGTPLALRIVPLNSLDSYRLEAQTVLEGGTLGTSKFVQNFLQEWDHEYEAYHLITDVVNPGTSPATVVPGEFTPNAMEMLQIGKTSWVKTGGGWMQVDGMQQPQVKLIGGIDLPTDWYSLRPVGEEMVAGIHCTRYAVDETIVDESMPNALLNGIHTKGDLWIASQAGIPSVIMRAELTMSVTKSFFQSFFYLPPDWASPTPKPGEQIQEYPRIFHYDYEVKEANQPVRIEPPAPAAPGQQG